MCVIMIADRARPDSMMVEAGFEANKDGAGVAWRQGGKAHWKKGLELEEVQQLAATLPLPFILHFRISTVGGNVPALTHPFVVSKESPLTLEGSTTHPLLFHNGHYNDWLRDMREVAMKTGNQLPVGKYSDSRAMAWIASILGLGFLETTDQRIVVIGPKEKDMVLFGGTWFLCNNVICSNKSWESKYNSLKYAAERGVAKKDEKKILTGQAISSPGRVDGSDKHPDGCVCTNCLETVTAIDADFQGARGLPKDHPLTKARAEYHQALAAVESEDLHSRPSKNRLKKLKRKVEEEQYKFTKQVERRMAKNLVENPGMLH